MSLANLIALVSSAHIDPTTAPECDDGPEVVETVIGRNLPRKERASKAPTIVRNQAAPIHDKASAPGVTLSSEEKLDAKSFIMAMRNAGKRRTEEGKPIFDKMQERNDQIKAIAAYTGYDNGRDFGSQQQAAMAKAQSELRGPVATGPSREELRAANRSLTGYVHGMPRPDQKILANLKAREQTAAEAMIDAKSDEDRATAKANLDAVRQALAEFGA